MITKDEYLQMVDDLNAHCRAYYVDYNATISDHEYDRRYKALEKVELEHPEWIVNFPPTQRVGGKEDGPHKKVVRDTPMLSLDNVYSLDELENWVNKTNNLLKKLR